MRSVDSEAGCVIRAKDDLGDEPGERLVVLRQPRERVSKWASR